MDDESTAPAAGAALLAAEAARAADGPADVQYEHVDGVIDLTWGHPDPSTFVTDEVVAATERVVAEHGWTALAYGAPYGAAFTRAAIADLVTRTDCPTTLDDVIVTAGSSGGLDLLLSVLAVPGDVVLVEQPTYFLALRQFADHRLHVVGLPSDGDGPDPAAFAAQCDDARAAGKHVFLYLVPTYANPTGRCLSVDRQEALLDVARAHGAHVIEDDVYRDTAPTAPPSMWSRDTDTVLRLGSFSKSLSPGMRIGYLTAGTEMVRRIGTCGLLDSGGGVNHFASMIVGELLHSGRFAEIAAAGQARYAARRAALAAALDPALFAFTVPDGGYFLWLGLPAGLTSSQVVGAAREQGVLVANGRNFFVGEPTRQAVRVSFSMLDEATLAEGARRLNAAVSSSSR